MRMTVNYSTEQNSCLLYQFIINCVPTKVRRWPTRKHWSDCVVEIKWLSEQRIHCGGNLDQRHVTESEEDAVMRQTWLNKTVQSNSDTIYTLSFTHSVFCVVFLRCTMMMMKMKVQCGMKTLQSLQLLSDSTDQQQTSTHHNNESTAVKDHLNTVLYCAWMSPEFLFTSPRDVTALYFEPRRVSERAAWSSKRSRSLAAERDKGEKERETGAGRGWHLLQPSPRRNS